MGKKIKKLLVFSAATFAGMYAYNKIVENTSTRKNLLKTDPGEFFEWNHGRIFYTKNGTGKPLLLIHDINTKSSGEEWSKINKKLAKKHTVYTIDLIGCGRSDKPAIQYTNYLYVQLITTFIKEVIKEKTDVIASNIAASTVFMTNAMDKTLFDKIILINPVAIDKMEELPNTLLKFKQRCFQLPIVGTFLYNILNSPAKIDILFKTKYFANPQMVTPKHIETYYESAHLGKSNGRFLFASIISNFVNFDIKHAVKKTDNTIYIIGSRDYKGNISTLEKYHRINNNFDITHISHGNLYPHMENPEKALSIIESKLV